MISFLSQAAMPQPASFNQSILLVARMVLRLRRALAAEVVRRKAARELGEFDDRMLADMGLRRGELGHATRLGHQ